jgi:Mlc titration factor MtfA (ptsG expression regulator)
VFQLFKRWLRARDDRPFPEEWKGIIEKNVPMMMALPPEERAELEKLVMAFIDDKHFEGAGGFEITDEVKVTVAAQACILLIRRDTDVYPDLETIIIYPSTFSAKHQRREGYVVIEEQTDRLGESWSRGIVVLAWDSVRSGTTNIRDGHNVVLHEFAHQLDAEDGDMDGAPDLDSRARYSAWAQVLGEEFGDLQKHVDAGRGTDIDKYGATNPAEFFAVVTETFFEKPAQLRAKHPELYDQLVDFYKQDPVKRLPPRAPVEVDPRKRTKRKI